METFCEYFPFDIVSEANELRDKKMSGKNIPIIMINQIDDTMIKQWPNVIMMSLLLVS